MAAYTATNVPYLRAILFFTFQPRSVFLRHPVLEILLPPRHLVFHFPTTSGIPQALRLSLLATSAPSYFSLSNPVRSPFSGTPSFEVHEEVVPTVKLGYGGVTSTYLSLRLGYNTASLTLGSGGRNLTPVVGYRWPKPTAIFNTLRAHLTLGQSNASLTLG